MNLANAMDGIGIALLLWLAGLGATALELWRPRAREAAFALALLATVGAGVWCGLLWPAQPAVQAAGGGLALDAYSLFVQGFVLFGTAFALLLARSRPEGAPAGSFGLILLSAVGAMVLAMAIDLVGVLAGWVLGLLPLWALAAGRAGPTGREAALKGVVLSALGVALLGLGTALLASRSGTTLLSGIGESLQLRGWIGNEPVLVAGVALVVGGLGLSVAAVPLHMWLPDAAQGLGPAGALLLTGSWLVAALAATARVLLVALAPVVDSGSGYLGWPEVLHSLGLLTLLVANALALVQHRLDRLFACLASGQAGMVLVALAATGVLGAGDPVAHDRALGAVLVFLAVHVITWVGLFLALEAVGGEGAAGLNRLDGLVHRHPWLAAAIGLALLCMAGLPPTAGFFARLFLLESLVEVGWIATAVVMALSLGLVLVMGLGLVGAMVLRSERPGIRVAVGPATTIAAWACSLAILALGLLPGGLLDVAVRSASALAGP